MTTIQLIILIIIVHFLADFALQTHEQATNKGEGNSLINKWLFYHVGVYTLIWSVVYLILPVHPLLETIPLLVRLFIFSVCVFIPHYLTDWCTSRIGKPFWKNKDLHNGFTVVGFDQVIHYLCLIWVFHFFKLL